MRASKQKGKGQRAKGKEIRNSQSLPAGRHGAIRNTEVHISGAEGLYEFREIDKITKEYFLRAMSHPKGMPDKIVITIEKIKQRLRTVPLLPVSTVQCGSASEASAIIHKLLSSSGVSYGAIKKGIGIVSAHAAMRGAVLMSCGSAIRREPDKKRGVRVSCLGIDRDSERGLSGRLARCGLNTPTVKEAIILASKVASCRAIVEELCISDDPDYTTGYVASKELGYVRIPNIKKKGASNGGRVFFIKEDTDVKKIIEYLEKTPVVVGNLPV